MQLAQRRYWVFDMDGTLTKAIHDFAHIRRMLDVPPEADILTYLDSLSEDEAASRFAWLREYEDTLARQATPAIGMARLLARLTEEEVSLGILTRNLHSIARLTLEQVGFSAYFPEEAILGREEADPKPDPSGLLKLASAWNVMPDTLVMVGDSMLDIDTGRAAGALTVLMQPTPEARAHLADVWVSDANALYDEVFDD